MVSLRLAGRARIRILLIVIVTIAGFSFFLWVRVKRSGLEFAPINGSRDETAGSSVLESPPPVPALSPTSTTQATPSTAELPEIPQSEPPEVSQTNNNAPLSSNFFGTLKLIIPVVGVRPDQLLDTFTDARSEGRAHDAIDIPAPAGTPVVAAADGEIIKLFQSDRGGTTIYQLSPDKKLVFYYAHLLRYADSLVAGKFARQGEVIGYVGDTGNPGGGNYHLHFSIAVVADPKRYWEGTNINPYPLLRK